MEYLGYFWVASFITIVLSTGFLIFTLMSGEHKKTSQMIFLGLIVTGLCVMSFIYLFPSESKDWLHTFSDIGQAFGVLNTLFSGFAFVGIYITFKTQREQLEVQKNESVMRMLKESFSELKTLGERYESEIKNYSSLINKKQKMAVDNILTFLKENGVDPSKQETFSDLFLYRYLKKTVPLNTSLSKTEIDLSDALFHKYLSQVSQDTSDYLHIKHLSLPLEKISENKIRVDEYTLDYRKICIYLQSIEVVLESFLDKKTSYPELENFFRIWQFSLPNEQLHVIFYFAFVYDPHVKETERHLGELLEQSSLFEYFRKLVVSSPTSHLDFEPFREEWFSKRKTISR